MKHRGLREVTSEWPWRDLKSNYNFYPFIIQNQNESKTPHHG